MGMIIRLAKTNDAEQIAAIYAGYVLNTPVSFEAEPPGAKEMEGRIATVLRDYPWLVCDIDGIVAGYAYTSQHRARYHYQWSVDVTVYIHPDFHRKRIGTALYTSLLSITPLQGYVSAFAGITLPNDGSVGLHESMGFTPVGIYRNVGFKLGRWHDVGWWQRPLMDAPEAAHPPISLSKVVDIPAWKEGIMSGARILNL